MYMKGNNTQRKKVRDDANNNNNKKMRFEVTFRQWLYRQNSSQKYESEA